jgi:hypothetical protein
VGGLQCWQEVCGPLPELGEECAVYLCADGLVCEGQVCVYARYPGDPCGDQDSVCVQSFCVDGTCRARAALGESCVDDNDCASRSCDGQVCVDPVDCLP